MARIKRIYGPAKEYELYFAHNEESLTSFLLREMER